MKLLIENWNKFVNEEIESVIDEGESGRKAGISSPHQILKLDPNFKFQKKPADRQQKLRVLQDVGNPSTATVFDVEGDIVGTLDLESDPYWLQSVVRYSPGDVERAFRTLKEGE